VKSEVILNGTFSKQKAKAHGKHINKLPNLSR